MNLKGFKKTHEDEYSATLQNQRGHSIRLAKKQLSKSHAEALDKLPLYAADGAEIEDPNNTPEPTQPTGAGPEGVPLASAENKQPIQPQIQQPAASQEQSQAVPPQVQPTQQLTPDQERKKAYDETQAQEAANFGKQDAMWDQDIANGHVTPKTYADLFASKSTLGKIGTIFGLIVGGIGSGMAHQENAALKMMQKELENDLDAQKTNKSNAMNYFRANLEHQKTKAEVGLAGAQQKNAEEDTLIKADTHTKNQMGIAMLHEIQSINDRLPPAQQAKGQMVIDNKIKPALAAQLQQNNNKAAKQLTESEFQRRGNLLRTAEATGVLPGGSQLAANYEERRYPGIAGETSMPVTPNDREYISSATNFDKQLNAFKGWVKTHSGDLNPKDRKVGETMAAELQGAYRQATNGGVYKEGEQNFISKLIDSTPTKFFNEIRVLPQLDVISKDNQRRMDTKLKSQGLSGLPGYSEDKVTGTYNGKPVVFKNGKWEYQ